ncbi:MAG: 3-dehydroquinate synthase [Endomicrobium sp.]|jgi:3-dehydroquinate synthase|nr:3-dehydroquinate synthase [Endomicrobium sp.]
MKKTITVHLKERKYDILVSQSTNDFFSVIKKQIKTKSLFIITDTNIAKLHLKYLINLFKRQNYDVKTAAISAGEEGKSIKNLSYLYDKALEKGIDRKSCAIAFGGGVIGDTAGFFAATYMRGIDFIQIPTTLLAMADSSVGGKTAINITKSKNIAGAFYQPKLVWINTNFLNSLPERQLRNGLAEIIKYAFIFDSKFYKYLANLLENEIISSKDFDYMICKSCSYKTKVVEKDEKETNGLRAVINFGHTYAHALETATHYKKFLHGEAVAIGMLFSAKLSLKLKLCKQETYNKVKKLLNLAAFNLDEKNNPKQFLSLMKKDKKSVDGNINFVLIKDIGKTINKQVSDNIVLNVLRSK